MKKTKLLKILAFVAVLFIIIFGTIRMLNETKGFKEGVKVNYKGTTTNCPCVVVEVDAFQGDVYFSCYGDTLVAKEPRTQLEICK